MEEKKGFDKNIAFVLIIICAILLISLVAAIANYTSIISYKDKTIQTQDDTIQSLTNQKNKLQTWLTGNITKLTGNISNLQNQIDSLEVPKLIQVYIRVDDSRGYPYTNNHLHVYGEVCNVGTDLAYNCKLHVVAYQSAVISIDTYIVLGTIEGEGWVHVDSNVYYAGSSITNYTITPEWTLNP